MNGGPAPGAPRPGLSKLDVSLILGALAIFAGTGVSVFAIQKFSDAQRQESKVGSCLNGAYRTANTLGIQGLEETGIELSFRSQLPAKLRDFDRVATLCCAEFIKDLDFCIRAMGQFFEEHPDARKVLKDQPLTPKRGTSKQPVPKPLADTPQKPEADQPPAVAEPPKPAPEPDRVAALASLGPGEKLPAAFDALREAAVVSRPKADALANKLYYSGDKVLQRAAFGWILSAKSSLKLVVLSRLSEQTPESDRMLSVLDTTVVNIPRDFKPEASEFSTRIASNPISIGISQDGTMTLSGFITANDKFKASLNPTEAGRLRGRVEAWRHGASIGVFEVEAPLL